MYDVNNAINSQCAIICILMITTAELSIIFDIAFCRGLRLLATSAIVNLEKHYLFAYLELSLCVLINAN